MLKVDVFPAPETPNKPKTSPAFTPKETPFTAREPPFGLFNTTAS
jgi:hypothetical protein